MYCSNMLRFHAAVDIRELECDNHYHKTILLSCTRKKTGQRDTNTEAPVRVIVGVNDNLENPKIHPFDLLPLNQMISCEAAVVKLYHSSAKILQ